MKKQIEAKLKQAEEQVVVWRQNLAQAQEQCIRWDAAVQVYRELLAEDVPVVPVKDAPSKNGSLTASEKADLLQKHLADV